MGGIGAIGSAAAAGAASGVGGAMPSLPSTSGVGDGIEGAAGAAGDGFGDMVTGALSQLDGLHQTADQLAIGAATGDLSDVHDFTIAATQAEVATQLTVAVRDKAIAAFNEIMRMQF